MVLLLDIKLIKVPFHKKRCIVIKRFDRFALITSMLALAQPLLWIVLFLSFNLAQGEKVEEVLGGLFVGWFFSFILSIISCILIFVHNRNTNASRIAHVAKKNSVIGIIPFPIVFLLWIVANCFS